MKQLIITKPIFIILMIFLVIFVVLSIKLIWEERSFSQEEKAINSLKAKLSSVVNNYNASYFKEHEVHFWAGHSGATDYTSKSKISIKVSNGQVIEYSIKYSREGWPVKSEDYYEYYDKSQNRLCREKIVSKSGCDPIPLNPPKLGGILRGCRLSLYPDGKGKCICDGELKPIEDYLGFACSEEKNTENMEIRYGHAIYYPETKRGFCYYEVRDLNSGQLWAFECDQENIELKPSITNNLEPLSNIKCYRYGYTSCVCTFNPVKILTCYEGEPSNFDFEVKSRILHYLEQVAITSISEENNTYGKCYTFFYDNLKHIFCFNEQNLITLAQWGKNITKENSRRVNIYKVKMI